MKLVAGFELTEECLDMQVFACKKCKKCFRKDASEFEER